MMRKALILIAAALALAALATPATAASELQVQATLEGDPVTGSNVTLVGITSAGSLIPSQTQVLTDGSAAFTDLEAGRYVVTVEHADASLRERVTLEANGSSSVTVEAGSAVTGTVVDRGTGEPVTGINVSLSDFFGVAGRDVTDANGSFEIAPVVLDANYTLYARYGGYNFEQEVTEGDGVTVRVAEPLTSDDDIEYRVTNGSTMHAGRMAVIDFDSVPVRLTDYYSAYNPADRPFSGTLEIQKTPGADVAGVSNIDGNALPYSIDNGTIYVNTTISAQNSTAVGVRYSLPGSTVELTADRYTESVLLMIASSNAELQHLDAIGPLTLDAYGQPVNTIRFMANGADIEKGTTFGVSIDRDAVPAPTTSSGTGGAGTGGSDNTDLYIAVGAALVVVAILVVSRKGDFAGGDGESLMDRIGAALRSTGASESAGATPSGAPCPECGAVSPGRFCPSCGAETATTCSGCGQEVGADAKFCPGCGQEQ